VAFLLASIPPEKNKAILVFIWSRKLYQCCWCFPSVFVSFPYRIRVSANTYTV